MTLQVLPPRHGSSSLSLVSRVMMAALIRLHPALLRLARLLRLRPAVTSSPRMDRVLVPRGMDSVVVPDGLVRPVASLAPLANSPMTGTLSVCERPSWDRTGHYSYSQPSSINGTCQFLMFTLPSLSGCRVILPIYSVSYETVSIGHLRLPFRQKARNSFGTVSWHVDTTDAYPITYVWDRDHL